MARILYSYKQVLFFFKKRLSNSYLLSDLVAVSCAAPGIFVRGWRGGGGGSIPDFFQVLNVSDSGSSMVYFGSNFF